MLIRRTDLQRFRALEEGYLALPAETRSRVSFESYCDGQDDLDEAKARAREYLLQAARADTHSSDVDPGWIDPWEER